MTVPEPGREDEPERRVPSPRGPNNPNPDPTPQPVPAA